MTEFKLNKEQAGIAADLLLGEAHRAGDQPIRIARTRNWAGMLALLPLILNAILSSHTKDLLERWWVVGAIYLGVVLGIVLYQALTPLVQITQEQFNYFGSLPWQRKSLAMDAIDSVVYRKKEFSLHDRYSVELEGSGKRIRISLNGMPAASVTRLLSFLGTRFDDRYMEIEE
jgi:hypothetical protein